MLFDATSSVFEAIGQDLVTMPQERPNIEAEQYHFNSETTRLNAITLLRQTIL
jgi:hypothetical protein